MVDLNKTAIALNLTRTDKQSMLTRYILRLMSQDGKSIRDKSTRRTDSTGKGRNGNRMEIYS